MAGIQTRARVDLPHTMSLLALSRLWIDHLAGGVEIVAAVVIGLAAVEALWRATPLFLRSAISEEAKVAIRLSLGRWLALGLEFAVAADILRTAVAPSWREIGQLAAIVVLRTGLNYSLEREIVREERRLAAAGVPTRDHDARAPSAAPEINSSHSL